MDETLDNLGETIATALPGSVTSHAVANGELTVHAVARDIVKLATFLRDDERCQFLSLLDVTAIDWPGSGGEAAPRAQATSPERSTPVSFARIFR